MKALSAAVSAAALLFASTVAAETRSADSLPAAGVKLSPGFDGLGANPSLARKGSRLGESDDLVGVPPLLILLGIGGAIGFLELAGVIDIFSDSPG